MGKLHAKGGSECFLTDQWYRLDQWSPYLCEGHIEITSIWSKNLARYIPRLCIVRGENLERKHWSQTLRNWKRWTHLKSMLKKPNAKEVSTRVSGEKFKFPNRRWNSQTIWKRSGSENIHLDTGQKAQTEKIKEIFKGNQTGHLQFHFKTHRRMMVKPEMIFGTFQGTTFTVITLNRESNCTCPEKHHSQFHWNISTLPERQILPWIFWHVDRDREWSDTWTGFTRFSLLNERNHQMGPHGRGETDKKKQTTLRPATLWPEIWKDMTDAFKRKEQQKWAIEKPKLDNAGRLRGVYRQKWNLLHLLTRTVPVSALRPVRFSRGDSASTTGTLDLDGEKKMPLKNKL